MTIYTRNTTATGVTNNAATLSQAQLDGNFVDLQQNKAGIASNNTFTLNNNFDTISQKVYIAGGSVNTYTITATGLAAPYVGQILTVDVSAIAVNTNNVPTLNINGGGAITISTGTVAGMQVAVGGLVGIQRFLYTGTYWFAIDQLSHYITTALVTDQIVPLGHTFVYTFSGVTTLQTRVSFGSLETYSIKVTNIERIGGVDSNVFNLVPANISAASTDTMQQWYTTPTSLGSVAGSVAGYNSTADTSIFLGLAYQFSECEGFFCTTPSNKFISNVRTWQRPTGGATKQSGTVRVSGLVTSYPTSAQFTGTGGTWGGTLSITRIS